MFGENTDRWSVSLQRWRAFFWMLRKQGEMYRLFMEEKALCICTKCPSAEFKLRSPMGVTSTDNIIVRCITLYGDNGDSLKVCPEFRRVPSEDYRCVVSTFRVDESQLGRLTKNKDELRILILCMDNRSANRLTARHIIWRLRKMENLLVGAVICFDHSLANGVDFG